MPGEDIQSWSTTASANANSDTSINWAEGQPRASVNNSARSMLAAHAKHRNLNNGSIVTGGTANAQTFTSGVGYTAVPTGLRVMLKIGNTNTDATTLNMDGIGAVNVLSLSGLALRPGDLVQSSYAEFLFDGTNWLLLRDQTGFGATPQQGRFSYVSPSTCQFVPYSGNAIKINGLLWEIPTAGIAGLNGVPGVFINGVGGQFLTASTVYYVYAFINSNVVTADFRTTGHATSTLLGNKGVEILSGDNSRTLIGMVRMNIVQQFMDDAANRFVLSWFNRRERSLAGANTNAASTTAGYPGTEISVASRANFITWGEEDVSVGLHGFMSDSVNGDNCNSSVSIDNTSVVMNNQFHAAGVGYQMAVGGFAAYTLTEGFHWFTPSGWGSGGQVTFYVQATGMIRG